MAGLPKYTAVEIERRWLVPLEVARALVPDRIRLITDLYVRKARLRVRAVQEPGKVTVFKLGKKYGTSAPGEEPVVSVYLTPDEYELLSDLPGRWSQKERRSITGGSLDIYLSPAHPFAVFEVEFQSGAQALAYAPPAFVGEEVTGNALYSGAQLATDEARPLLTPDRPLL